MLNSIPSVQVSDTTDDDSSNAADYIISFIIIGVAKLFPHEVKSG